MDKALQLRVLAAMQDSLSGPLKMIGGRAGESAQRMQALRDRLKALNTAQREVGQFRELSTGLQSTRAEMAAATQRVAGLAREMQATTNPTRAMRREFDQAVRAAQQLKTKHGEQSAELQRLRNSLSNAGISTGNLSRDERTLRQRIEQTNHALDSQASRLKEVAKHQQRLATAREKYSAGRSAAGAMAGMGAGGVAAGGAMLYTGGKFIAPGLDFDASMSKVQALARLDKSSADMIALRTQARELGAATQFTAGQAADAQSFLAMAGFSPQAILSAMPGMLSLAKAGDTDLAQTADIASNILTGFKLPADKMSEVGDVLVGAFTRSNTNLYMLGETMKYVAPVAAGVGQDIETMAAMAGKLGDAGIQGSMGGTALRAIISRLAAPPKMAADALEELGIKTSDANGNLRDMPSILEELYKKTEKLGSADRAGMFKHIAGEEAFSALQVLVEQAGTGELQKFIGTLRKVQGEADKTAGTMADNLKGDLDQLKSAWEDLGIEIEEQNDGPLRAITQGFAGVVGSIKTWAAENPKLSQALTVIAATLAVVIAGLGALTLALASILGPFIIVRYALSLFGIQGGSLLGVLWNLTKGALPALGRAILFVGRLFLANPIGLAVTAIGLAAYAVYRYWEPIKAFFSELWTSITAAFDASVLWISDLLQRWNPIALLGAAWTGVTEFFSGLWDQIKTAFDAGLGTVGELLSSWSPLDLISQAISGALSLLGIDMPGKFSEFGTMLIQGLVNGISSMANVVKESISNIGSGIVGWFKEKLGIRSPSRVFMGMGEFVSEGAAIGIERQQPAAVKAAQALAASVTLAGALTAPGVAYAGGDITAQEGIAARFDTRAALPARQAGSGVVVQGDTISINIHASGLDERQIQAAIERALANRDADKAARVRSALYDYGN